MPGIRDTLFRYLAMLQLISLSPGGINTQVLEKTQGSGMPDRYTLAAT